MRKLIVSMNITLDGYLSGPDGGLDWHFNCWTEELRDALCDQLAKADTILLGRVTYEAMAEYWPLKSVDPFCRNEDFAFANMMNSYAKIVVSNSIQQTLWNNTQILKGNLQQQITNIQKKPGRDIIVYGSSELIKGLMKANLPDEYHLWVHPVILGKGKSLFTGWQHHFKLNMINTKTFSSGVVLIQYSLLKANTRKNKTAIQKIAERI